MAASAEYRTCLYAIMINHIITHIHIYRKNIQLYLVTDIYTYPFGTYLVSTNVATMSGTIESPPWVHFSFFKGVSNSVSFEKLQAETGQTFPKLTFYPKPKTLNPRNTTKHDETRSPGLLHQVYLGPTQRVRLLSAGNASS